VWWIPLVVAVIGGPIMWFLQRFDKRNTAQHGESQGTLHRIEARIEKLDDRIHEHFIWHGDKEGS
jgi:uncharacterized membrane-anchored protein YhcB (DUF1043 family)